MKKNTGIHMNELDTKMKKSVKTRVISAIVAACIAVPLLFLGDVFFLALAIIILLFASYELVKCAKPKHSIWLFIISFLLITSMALWPILRGFAAGHGFADKIWESFDTLYISIFVLGVSFVLLFAFVIFDKNFSVRDACFIFTVGVVIGLGIQSVMYLRYIPIASSEGYVSNSYFNFFENFQSASLLIYVALATFATDIGAFFVGILFGKNKINERISPKKTWEGFFGGIVISAILSTLFALIFAWNGCPIISIFTADRWYFIVILSLLLPFGSTLGDFVFSSFKRYYGIKDFGNLIPGHGGALDRFDSLIFSAIFAAVYIATLLSIINGGANPLL